MSDNESLLYWGNDINKVNIFNAIQPFLTHAKGVGGTPLEEKIR